VRVVIPVHNRVQTTQKLIACLQKQTLKDFQIVLVDDGSSDGTAQMVLSYFPNTTVIRGKGSWWWSGSLHQAYKALKREPQKSDETIVILNDDITFERDFLEIGEKLISRDPRQLLLPYNYDQKTKRLIDWGVHLNWQRLTFKPAAPGEVVNVLATRGLFLKKSTFMAIGGFHPILIPHYLSDYDFTHRAFRKGFPLVATDAIKVYEDTSQSGLRLKEINSLKAFWQNYFSKRSTGYFPAWLFFVIFNSPKRYLLLNLYRLSPLKVVIPYLRKWFKVMSDIYMPQIVRGNFSIIRELPGGNLTHYRRPFRIKGAPSNLYRTDGWAVDPMQPSNNALAVIVFRNGQPIRRISRTGVKSYVKSLLGMPADERFYFHYYERGADALHSAIEFYALSADGLTLSPISIEKPVKSA
jgi:GT2 family glycosyltransferase